MGATGRAAMPGLHWITGMARSRKRKKPGIARLRSFFRIRLSASCAGSRQ